MKGHKVSEETRRKIRISVLNGLTDEVHKRKSMANLKRFSNPDERIKLSNAHKGKKLSEEHKRKISEATKGKKKNRRNKNGFCEIV